MKKILFSFFISLLLSGCYHRTCEQARLVHQVTDSFSSAIKKRGDFYLTCYGGVYFPIVREISLGYDLERKLDLQEARKLLVQCVSALLEKINQSEELRPYLDQYPYSVYGIHFTISFVDKKNREFTDKSIARVSLFGFKNPDRATVSYYIFDPEKYRWPEIYKETYAEAERIVKSGVQ